MLRGMDCNLIDTSLWNNDELNIFKFYNYKCLRCNKPATVLHELVPKSKAPKNWKVPSNRVALCSDCHDWAHRHGANNSRKELISIRKRKFPDAIWS